MEPKLRTDETMRAVARNIRDSQWAFMERLAREGTVHVCPWNKYRLEERSDELMFGLIDWLEMNAWIRRHADWFVLGEDQWNAERHTFPVSLTVAGREALQHRELYDMEPVEGGLVEPGWQAIPAPRADA